MTLTRRYLVLLSLMFWQGGFTFYAAIVVPIGSHVLGSHLQQGLVTRWVTNYLNLAGAAALLIWACDIAVSTPPRRWLRWSIWAVMAAGLVVLFWLHVQLDELIDGQQILDRPRFKFLHRWYLHTSTMHWASSLILALLTLRTWQVADGEAQACKRGGSTEQMKQDAVAAGIAFIQPEAHT